MKKLILVIGIIICLVAAHVVFGQVSEGSIIYNVKVNMHRTLPADRQEMRQMVPEFNSYQDRLLFKGGESLYKTVDDEEEDEFAGDGGAVRVRLRRPLVEYYLNHDLGRKIRYQEFFGKKYIIEDSIRILPWKFGSETKSIQGYICKKATYFNEERNQNIVAWYTEQLKPFLGPENYNSLPGTVLGVDINDGERVINATNIQVHPLKKGELKMPANGQKISDKDFRQLMEDQMKKMGAQGGMIIRTN